VATTEGDETGSQHRPASITLVRHGQSHANLHDPESVADVPGELRGTPNHKVALTPTGHQQARDTGAGLARAYPQGFDHVYVSPFLRTQQTVAGLFEGFPVEWRRRLEESDAVRRDILLREQDFGYADMMGALPDTAAHFEEVRQRFEAHKTAAGKFYTRPDNGDSWADVCQRTYMFLGKLFQANRAGAHVLVVSHAVTIATFAFHLERLTEDGVIDLYHEPRKIQNCAVARYEFRPGRRPRWERTAWNRDVRGDDSQA
jgi:broad specificity phosphatase PhoE